MMHNLFFIKSITVYNIYLYINIHKYSSTILTSQKLKDYVYIYVNVPFYTERLSNLFAKSGDILHNAPLLQLDKNSIEITREIPLQVLVGAWDSQ